MADWISIKERLPDDMTTVIAAEGRAILGIMNYNHGFNCIRTPDGEILRDAEITGVTHWLPAPPPPGEPKRAEVWVKKSDVLALCPFLPAGGKSDWAAGYASGVHDYKALLKGLTGKVIEV